MYNSHVERIKAIDMYYTNLEYNIHKEEALIKIATLSETLKLEDLNTLTLSYRFLNTLSIIEEHSFLFKSVCKHIDIYTAIIEYLNTLGRKIVFMLNEQRRIEIIISILLTIYNICNEKEVESFLKHCIIKDSILESTHNIIYKCRHEHVRNGINYIKEMILLEDSDLYAVINCLKIIKISDLQNIWIHESIKQKFLSLRNKYFHNLNFFPRIYIFRSKEELLTQHISDKTIIVSIWTEDIMVAKNLALLLNRDIVFINTYMDFRGGIFYLPFNEICRREIENNFMDIFRLFKFYDFDVSPDVETVCLLPNHEIKSAPMYNLFYDGRWQKPVKGIYWKYNNSLWANATEDDIRRCFNSAKKGFEIWSTKSAESKLQILSEFATILENDGKSVLATIVSRWIKFSYFCKSSQGVYSQNEGMEVIQTRKPKGIIFLKEENENVLFFRLMQILIAGNSVITICDQNFCNPMQYYEIFTTCKMPPGVINLLSNENLLNLELMLCVEGTYEKYAKFIFSKGTSKEAYTLPYLNLTLSKQIILSIK